MPDYKNVLQEFIWQTSDIKPEYPNNPHIIIKNDFKKSLNEKSQELILKIKKIV